MSCRWEMRDHARQRWDERFGGDFKSAMGRSIEFGGCQRGHDRLFIDEATGAVFVVITSLHEVRTVLTRDQATANMQQAHFGTRQAAENFKLQDKKHNRFRRTAAANIQAAGKLRQMVTALAKGFGRDVLESGSDARLEFLETAAELGCDAGRAIECARAAFRSGNDSHKRERRRGGRQTDSFDRL